MLGRVTVPSALGNLVLVIAWQNGHRHAIMVYQNNPKQSQVLFLTSRVDLFNWNLLYVSNKTFRRAIDISLFHFKCVTSSYWSENIFCVVAETGIRVKYQSVLYLQNIGRYRRVSHSSLFAVDSALQVGVFVPDIKAYNLWLPAPYAKALLWTCYV